MRDDAENDALRHLADGLFAFTFQTNALFRTKRLKALSAFL
jgi:hypothetical protein